MDTATHLTHFDREHESFLAACALAAPAAEVPTCPGWSVADLMYHLYEVQYGWHRLVAERREEFDGIDLPARPADDQLAAIMIGEHAGYAAMLRAFPADTSIWTWAGTESFAWLARRMAQEALVHRVDADLAAAVTRAPVDAELASDGIDEFLFYFANNANGPVAGTVHLHCTDVEGEWLAQPDGKYFAVTREHAKGDCAIRGAAEDILMALWRRAPLTACEVVGDAEIAAAFVAASRLD